MSIGPSEDWNKVPVKWHGVYLDGTVPTGELEFSVTWDRAIDDDAVDPVVIIGKPITAPIVAGECTVQLPASDDPDIDRNDFTYHVKENLDDGGGAEYDFVLPLASMPDGIILTTLYPGVPTDPGELQPSYARMFTGAGAPDDADGHDGDIYIDTSGAVLYNKVAGDWGSGVSLVGGGGGGGGATDLEGLTDVDLTSPANLHILQYNGSQWVNVLGSTVFSAAAHNHDAAYQPLDADLTSIAALTTTAYGRAFLELANQAALVALLPAYQPLDSDLTSIAALSTTAYGRALLELANQAALMALIASSTDTAAGKVELATNAEAQTGTDTVRAVTPAGLKAAIDDAKTAILGVGVPAALDTLDELAAALGDDANFAANVTSSLAGKQPLDSDLTSIASLTTTTYGRAFLELANQAGLMALLQAATETASGIAELATQTEVNTGTDDVRIVTPLKLATRLTAYAQPLDSDLTSIAALTTTSYGRAFLALADQAALMGLIPSASTTVEGKVELATSAEAITGTDTTRAVTPAALAARVPVPIKDVLDLAESPSSPVTGDIYLRRTS
jgi:hypothetical protein